MQLITLENKYLKLTLSPFGASWLSCIVKHPKGEREVLVTTSAKNWQKQTAYFGATIGRYANRIANAQYQLNGKTYQLAANNGRNNLHGGNVGADKVEWEVLSQSPQAVKFAYCFADGEEGFGGEVKTTVEYSLNDDCLDVYFSAQASQDTPLCLTNHAYFNLSGEPTIKHHRLQLNASHYLPVDENGTPNKPLQSVEGTSFDFRQAKIIGEDLLSDVDQQKVKGYDHAFLIAKKTQDFTACLTVADLTLKLDTSYPAIQIYTGNWLKGQPNMQGGEYEDYAGIALEPEFFPNSPNQPELAKFGGILKANEPYNHKISYQFMF